MLTSRKLTSSMHSSWSKLMKEVDYIHVLSDWGRDMLERQKVNSNKIHLIRTAGPNQLFLKKRRVSKKDNSLKLVFWGRCNPQRNSILL